MGERNICGSMFGILTSGARFGVLVLTLLVAAAGASADTPEVTKTRIGIHPDKTRFVLEMTESLPYRIFLLGNPYRVVIDLPNVSWRAAAPQLTAPEGVVANYRFGLFRPGNSRVVIDVTGPVIVAEHNILKADGSAPDRFFIDLKPVNEKTFQAALGNPISHNWSPVEPEVAATPKPDAGRAAKAGNGRRVVMLDPGHGGVDPGAIGARGAFESHVTLAVAEDVKRAMEATGRYVVHMTRSRDIYVPLRDRFAKAETVDAELFISLHADSIGNRRVRGASVYTLSERASDSEAEALATKENRSDIIAGVDLSRQSSTVASVLISLRQRHTMDESAHFARFLVDDLGTRIPLLRNTHRFAGFAVLKSPDVPSVLIELGYLSNREDEKMLQSEAFRSRVSRALLDAADAYFSRKERLSRS